MYTLGVNSHIVSSCATYRVILCLKTTTTPIVIISQITVFIFIRSSLLWLHVRIPQGALKKKNPSAWVHPADIMVKETRIQLIWNFDASPASGIAEPGSGALWGGPRARPCYLHQSCHQEAVTKKTSWKKLVRTGFRIIHVVFPLCQEKLDVFLRPFLWRKDTEWHLLDFIGGQNYIKYIKRIYPWEIVWVLICIPLWTFLFLSFFFQKKIKK